MKTTTSPMETTTAPRRGRLLDIMAVFGVPAIILAIGLQFAGDGLIARQGVLGIANIAMIGMVVAALRRRGETLAHLGLRRPDLSARSLLRFAGAFLAALVLAAVAFVAVGAIMAKIVGVPEPTDLSAYDFLRGNLPMLFLFLAGVFITSSFGEELVYRGFLTTRLAEVMGGSRRAWVWAVVLGSVIFGLAHVYWGLTGIVQTTLVGLVFAGTWLLSKRNLWVVILAHAILDALLMVQLYLG